MRHALALALIGLSTLSPGCALVEDSCRNLCVGLKTPLQEHREKARNRQWAESAWQQVCATVGPERSSEDYAQGFKEGFAEYLFRGGDGEPPLVAPLRYRDPRYQNPEGYQRVHDWFHGYRHGSTMARVSGARTWITGPSSLQGELDATPIHENPPPVIEHPPSEIPLPKPKVLPEPQPEQVWVEPVPPQDIGVAPPLQMQMRQPGVEPPLNPPLEPLPEPVRLRILKITEAAQTAPGQVIRITGVQTPGAPARPRITGINAAPE